MAQTYLKKIDLASKAECRNRRKIRLILLILTIAGSLFEITEYKVRWAEDFNYNYAYLPTSGNQPSFDGFVGIFLMFVAAACGLFAVHGVFSDLTSKQVSDVQLSLPMSAKDRFLSKLLAVFKLHLLPMMIGGAAVIVIGSAVQNGFDCMGYIVRFQLVTFACALFVDAISIFCISCCGAKAEGIYTSIITGCCVTFTPILLVNLTTNRFSGVSNTLISFKKPFTLVGGMVISWAEKEYFINASAYVEGILYIIGNIIASCLLIFATYFIYRRRDGRQVGKPIVYGLFLELFMLWGLISLFTIVFFTGGWLIGLTISAIICIVIRIVLARAKITPVHFLAWVLKYAAALALFIVVVAAAYFTGGFGCYKLRPHIYQEGTTTFQVETSERPNGKYRCFQSVCNVSSADADDQATAVSPDELREKYEEINALIDDHYTLSDRSLKGFLYVLSTTNMVGVSSETENSVRVTVTHSDVKDVDSGDYYNLSFWVNDEQLQQLNERAGSILQEIEYYER